jgi:hypothetical protein
VAFTVSRGTGQDGIGIDHAGLLGRLGNAVDVGAEGDDRLAVAPAGDPGGGNAGHAALDLEPVLLEDAGQVLRGFDLLKAEFAEAEHGIDHDLGHLGHFVDAAHRIGLIGGRPVGLGGGGNRCERACRTQDPYCTSTHHVCGLLLASGHSLPGSGAGVISFFGAAAIATGRRP